jgi:hypothetical protein
MPGYHVTPEELDALRRAFDDTVGALVARMASIEARLAALSPPPPPQPFLPQARLVGPAVTGALPTLPTKVRPTIHLRWSWPPPHTRLIHDNQIVLVGGGFSHVDVFLGEILLGRCEIADDRERAVFILSPETLPRGPALLRALAFNGPPGHHTAQADAGELPVTIEHEDPPPALPAPPKPRRMRTKRKAP